MEDKYITYKAADFAAEESFIEWVRKRPPQLDRAWTDWLEHHPELQPEVETATRLVKGLQFKEPSFEGADRLWARIAADTQTPAAASPKVTRRFSISYIAMAAAASVALLLYFGWGWFGGQTVQVGAGENLVYQLPDASSVHLNAGSEIAFSSRKWSEERQVKLQGEAFFEVEKGNAFIVTTDNGQVEVLGTSFNVYSREDRFRVACSTGRVQVSSGQKSVLLTPGESCYLSAAGDLVKVTAVEKETAWRKGVFQFENQPLAEVFGELERQYKVTIEATPEILQQLYTGAFDNKQLDSALYNVCWPMKLNAVRDGSEINIVTE